MCAVIFLYRGNYSTLRRRLQQIFPFLHRFVRFTFVCPAAAAYTLPICSKAALSIILNLRHLNPEFLKKYHDDKCAFLFSAYRKRQRREHFRSRTLSFLICNAHKAVFQILFSDYFFTWCWHYGKPSFFTSSLYRHHLPPLIFHTGIVPAQVSKRKNAPGCVSVISLAYAALRPSSCP